MLPPPCSQDGGGICTEDPPQAEPEIFKPDAPTYPVCPETQDAFALFFLYQVLPYMQTQVRDAPMAGVRGYDYNFFYKHCEKLELSNETTVAFLNYLRIFEAALLTSQAERGGDGGENT